MTVEDQAEPSVPRLTPAEILAVADGRGIDLWVADDGQLMHRKRDWLGWNQIEAAIAADYPSVHAAVSQRDEARATAAAERAKQERYEAWWATQAYGRGGGWAYGAKPGRAERRRRGR